MSSSGTKLLLVGVAAVIMYSQFGGLGVILVGAALLLMSK